MPLLVLNDPAAFSQLLVDIVFALTVPGFDGHAYSNAPSSAKAVECVAADNDVVQNPDRHQLPAAASSL